MYQHDYPRDICAGDAIALMGAVVDEVGREHRYAKRVYRDTDGNDVACVLYVSQGEADCLFGRMLERFGVPASSMAFACHLQIGWVLARLHIIAPPQLAANLRNAQIIHDLGYEWGRVYDYFVGLCVMDAERGVRL